MHGVPHVGLMMVLFAVVAIAVCAASRPALSEVRMPDGAKTELLWPDGAPGALGHGEADTPMLVLCPAPKEKANGLGVIVCPGGGYGGLALDHEGAQVAQWLNDNGISAFVLKYRVAPYKHPIPLGDAQRAMRIVRSRAAEWGVDPHRLGMLGFSAGGHLVSTAGTHFDLGDPNASDPLARVSCRPDFLVLIYPVITFKPPYAHMGSRHNLIGEDAPADFVDLLCNDEQVTKETPPTFLVHTSGDSGVPAENSVLFYLALRKAGVPAEMHIYEKGEHGFGLGPGDPVLSTWPKLCIEWMKSRK